MISLHEINYVQFHDTDFRAINKISVRTLEQYKNGIYAAFHLEDRRRRSVRTP